MVKMPEISPPAPLSQENKTKDGESQHLLRFPRQTEGGPFQGRPLLNCCVISIVRLTGFIPRVETHTRTVGSHPCIRKGRIVVASFARLCNTYILHVARNTAIVRANNYNMILGDTDRGNAIVGTALCLLISHRPPLRELVVRQRIPHIRAPAGRRTQYAFSKLQNDALTELLAEADGLGALLGDLSVSQEQARSILQNLPPDLGPERRAVVESACKLVGKVTYYWGGKSLVLGWDSRWGTLRKVTAAGSTTTGSYRPYGLDCSGMVDWAFYNATGGEYVIGHGGGAHAQHTYCTDISWDEAQPGDLVFYPEDEHVGIVGDWDDNGDLLIIHCASSANNVVITGASGFTSVAEPIFYSE